MKPRSATNAHHNALLTTLATMAVLGVARSATFTGLGDLPGDIFSSTANAVSADGSVVVGSSKVEGRSQAFRWDATTGMQPIGTSTTVSTFAYGISADGSIITGNESESDGNFHAFRWTQTGGFVALGKVAPFTRSGGSIAVGERIYGFSGSPNAGDNYIADGTGCYWDASSTTASAVSGMFFVTASNAAGTLLGGSRYVGTPPFPAQPPTEPCLRRNDGTVIGLGWLAGFESFGNVADLSADGSVAVGWVFGAGQGQAFRWTASTGMIGLGDLPGGAVNSAASAVSADGGLVVGEGRDDAGGAAFVWDARHGMRRLKAVLATVHGLSTGEWILRRATAIAADGSVVVGYGLNPAGNTEAFRITGFLSDPPTLAIAGKKKRKTAKQKIRIRGAADDDRDLDRVEYRVGKKGAFRPAAGTFDWSFKAKLKPGLNRITVRAVDIQGKRSPDATVKVIRLEAGS